MKLLLFFELFCVLVKVSNAQSLSQRSVPYVDSIYKIVEEKSNFKSSDTGLVIIQYLSFQDYEAKKTGFSVKLLADQSIDVEKFYIEGYEVSKVAEVKLNRGESRSDSFYCYFYNLLRRGKHFSSLLDTLYMNTADFPNYQIVFFAVTREHFFLTTSQFASNRSLCESYIWQSANSIFQSIGYLITPSYRHKPSSKSENLSLDTHTVSCYCPISLLPTPSRNPSYRNEDTHGSRQ